MDEDFATIDEPPTEDGTEKAAPGDLRYPGDGSAGSGGGGGAAAGAGVEILKSDPSGALPRVSQQIRFAVSVSDENGGAAEDATLVQCWVDREGRLRHYFSYEGGKMDHGEGTFVDDAFVVYAHRRQRPRRPSFDGDDGGEEEVRPRQPKTVEELSSDPDRIVLCSYRLRGTVEAGMVHLVRCVASVAPKSLRGGATDYRVSSCTAIEHKMEDKEKAAPGDLRYPRSGGGGAGAGVEILKSDPSGVTPRVSQQARFVVSVSDENGNAAEDVNLVQCWVTRDGCLQHYFTYKGGRMDHGEGTYVDDAFVVYAEARRDPPPQPRTVEELSSDPDRSVLCSYRLRGKVGAGMVHSVTCFARVAPGGLRGGKTDCRVLSCAAVQGEAGKTSGANDLCTIETVKIPMRDGIHLAATVYRPKKDRDRPPPPVPAIFWLDPYGVNDSARGIWYAQRGYALAMVKVRGCVGSEGTFQPFENEGRDGFDTVEWLARQGWCDGNVVMFGSSYLGWSQWTTAKEFPKGLRAIVPGAPTYPGTEGVPKNRNMFLPYIMSWFHQTKPTSGKIEVDPKIWFERKKKMYLEHVPFNKFDKLHFDEGSSTFQKWLKHPAVDEYWDAMNPTADDYAQIDIPVLTITGCFDADQTGAMTHHRRHYEHSTPEAREKQFLIVGPWDHGGCFRSKRKNGGITFDEACVVDNFELQREFFDWAVKDGKRPTFLEDNVAYYVMGAERWKYAHSLDGIPTEPRKFFIGPGEGDAKSVSSPGILSLTPPTASTVDSYEHDPLDKRPGEFEMSEGTEDNSYNIFGTNAFSRRYAQSVSQFGNGLIYESEPLTEDAEIAGFARLVVWMSMTTLDADFLVNIHEIRSDGTSIQLTDDGLRARYRRSPRTATLVTPGEVDRYEFNNFWFFARRLERGSRIRMVFWCANSIHLEKNYNGGGVVAEESEKDAEIAIVSVHQDADRQSYLELPFATPT